MVRSRLNIIEKETVSNSGNEITSQIISSFDNLIIRTYSHIRFRIIPLRFLEEISQYMPTSGSVLDLGCGFGLFTLYFALTHPNCSFIGVDLSERRVQMAKKSARDLGVSNAKFVTCDARTYAPEENSFSVVFTLDLLHHLPPEDGDSLVRTIHSSWLGSGGTFVLKDVTTRPRAYIYFTFMLDMLMNPKDRFWYRSSEVWADLLSKTDFNRVERHYLWDILPYPHVLIIARK